MKTQILERGPEIRRRILRALVFVVPVIFLRSLNDPFNVPKLALIMAGVAIVLAIKAAEILQGASPQGLKRLLFPAAAIGIPVILSWIFALYRGWSLFGLYGRFQGLIPYLILILFGLLIADSFGGNVLPLARAFVWGAAIMGAYAVFQYLGWDPFEWSLGGDPGQANKVALSTTGNPNFTGGFLGIALPVAIGLAVLDVQRRRVAIVLAVAVAYGLYAADSQGGWLAGAAGSALVGGYLLRKRFRFAPLAGAAVAMAAAIFAVGIVTLAVVDPDNGRTSETVLWRGRWWIAASRMAMDRPITGMGPNSFAIDGVSYRTEGDAVDLIYNFADDPHSVFFALLANAGVLGAAGYVALLGWVIWQGIRIDPDENPLAPLFLAGSIAYFVQSLVSIDELSLRLALWVMVGGLAASMVPAAAPARKKARPASKRRKRPARRESLQSTPAVVAVGVAALAATVWSLLFVMADGRVLQARTLFSQGEIEEAQDQMESAIGFRSDTDYRQTYGFEIGQVALGSETGGQDEFQASREAFAYLEDMHDVGGLVTYGRILNAWGENDPAALAEAVKNYGYARDQDPLNPVIAIEMADVYNAMGEYTKAAEVLDATYDTGRFKGEWWAALALARAAANDIEGAELALDIALKSNPEDPRAVEAQSILEGATS